MTQALAVKRRGFSYDKVSEMPARHKFICARYICVGDSPKALARHFRMTEDNVNRILEYPVCRRFQEHLLDKIETRRRIVRGEIGEILQEVTVQIKKDLKSGAVDKMSDKIKIFTTMAEFSPDIVKKADVTTRTIHEHTLDGDAIAEINRKALEQCPEIIQMAEQIDAVAQPVLDVQGDIDGPDDDDFDSDIDDPNTDDYTEDYT